MSTFGHPDRRHFMTHAAAAGAVSVPGINFLTNLRASAAEMKKNRKSLIILWMGGGPTTIDLWDMKPDHANGGGSAGHKPKPTAASGISISEHLPKVAAQFKNLSIIRSLTTSEGDHMRGTTLMSTGRLPNPLSEYPHMGSALSYLYSQDAEAMKNMDLPAFISVGNGRVGPGFLGMKYSSFVVQNPGGIPENVEPPKEYSSRLDRRKVLFESLEGSLKTNVPADSAQAHKDVYGKALQLVTSNRKNVFVIDPAKDKADLDRYGNDGFGKGCLLAKKLTEAGVACVEVSLGGWDMHQNIHATLANQRLPNLDRGMGSLVEDLAQSGRLKDTVIVWMGEFGRTPRINQNGGRDHFPRAWSVVVGGGNIKGGIAYGATAEDGASVKDNPVKIGNLYATLFRGLGFKMDEHGQIRDNLGRPRELAANPTSPTSEERAEPVKDLVS